MVERILAIWRVCDFSPSKFYANSPKMILSQKQKLMLFYLSKTLQYDLKTNQTKVQISKSTHTLRFGKNCFCCETTPHFSEYCVICIRFKEGVSFLT